MSLSALKVQKAKGRERPYKLSDGGGLYLLVDPTGRRYWRLGYRWGGKQKSLSFGVYPDVSLSKAREKRDEAREMLASGEDPVAIARERKLAAKLAMRSTFRHVAEEWLEKREREGRMPVTIQKQRWLFKFLYPKLGDRPIKGITPHEVYEVLKKVEDKRLYETARRLRSTCGQVFRYAVATGRAERDVCADLKGALIAPKVKHLPAITTSREAGELLCAIEGFDGYRVTHFALRLAPHLFVRPGELRQAEWEEFDLEERVWTIPAEKMKMGRPHSVPLSKQALAILADVRPVTSRDRYVFPCNYKRNRPMCENTLNAALHRLGYKGRMCAHGFRAMASSLLNEMGEWNPDAIERQLAHIDVNSIRRVYSRGEYWAERVRMMQVWSNYLDDLRAAAEMRRTAEPKTKFVSLADDHSRNSRRDRPARS